MSRVLARTSNGIILKENCHFVYGGDVCDRGPGDIRVLEDIVKLKRDNPDNVHIILGNRDINKMRLLTELLPEFTCKPSRTYWTGDIDDKGEHNAVNRLKAILIDTMGAPDTFEHRRQELKDLGRDSSDEAVVQSFWDLLKPEGLLTEYLKQGTLAVLLGDTLFLHGGLHSNSLGWIPPSRDLPPGDSGHHVDNVATWCEQLEAFRAAEMKDFVEFSQWLQLSSGQASERRLPFTSHWSAEGGYNHPTPGSRLLQYGMGWMPDKSVNPTLVYDNFLSDGAPMPPSSEIASKLRRNGVRRVIAGHQPHGDAPVVIDSFGLQVITGDTSYANNVKWFGPDASDEYRERVTELLQQLTNNGDRKVGANSNTCDTRGNAVSEIYLRFGIPTSQSTCIHGELNNGLRYDFELSSSDENPYVGRATEDGWWVKGKVATGSQKKATTISEEYNDGLLAYMLRMFSSFCLPESEDTIVDDDVYLICLSKGRDVYNSLELGSELKKRVK
eukprot:CAMPEP_0185024566 /NCGR_PEP_ID=MMETSP1103-20130426/7681_1 /TAXON_ID=36769 /ORGANISM="Paraphysomonas bandaiensis, Strain Caron Lab Isolate" /LENGTH=499 /DNA_ID=CAMNT_0027557573 /DNA_START=183 /DNA_END=1682 /DNA_ORIENTATION=+